MSRPSITVHLSVTRADRAWIQTRATAERQSQSAWLRRILNDSLQQRYGRTLESIHKVGRPEKESHAVPRT